MSGLVSKATQAEEGGFGSEVNPINRNYYRRAAPTNLRFSNALLGTVAMGSAEGGGLLPNPQPPHPNEVDQC